MGVFTGLGVDELVSADLIINMHLCLVVSESVDLFDC